MQHELAEKVAIVFAGGGAGIGGCAARILAREGAAVVVADVDETGATAIADGIVAAGGAAVAIRADVTDDADVRRTVQTAVREFGGVDVCVNNAAISDRFPGMDLLNVDLGTWDGVFDTNVKGTLRACRAVLPLMIERGGG